jgi:predicted phage terminase large subunit-like protein
VNPEGGKVVRAAAVSPLIEASYVYLPHPDYAPWVGDFIEECAAFPNGAHDDQVDAMTQALRRWGMVPAETVLYFAERVQISPI